LPEAWAKPGTNSARVGGQAPAATMPGPAHSHRHTRPARAPTAAQVGGRVPAPTAPRRAHSAAKTARPRHRTTPGRGRQCAACKFQSSLVTRPCARRRRPQRRGASCRARGGEHGLRFSGFEGDGGQRSVGCDLFLLHQPASRSPSPSTETARTEAGVQAAEWRKKMDTRTRPVIRHPPANAAHPQEPAFGGRT